MNQPLAYVSETRFYRNVSKVSYESGSKWRKLGIIKPDATEPVMWMSRDCCLRSSDIKNNYPQSKSRLAPGKPSKIKSIRSCFGMIAGAKFRIKNTNLENSGGSSRLAYFPSAYCLVPHRSVVVMRGISVIGSSSLRISSNVPSWI